MRVSYLFILQIILLPILFFFFTRGVITHDEGYILHSAEKISQGLVIYRDFSFVYTPLSAIATAIWFSLFSSSILVSRILMLLVALLSTFLIFKIIHLSTRNRMYATLAVLIFVAWGPTHINFSWPVMYSIVTGLAVCFFLLKFLETRLVRFLFLAGIVSFLVFLTKQNFGAALALPILAFFLVKNARKISYILMYLSGYSWGVIIFCIYLLSTDSFAPFILDFYSYTIQRILINETLSTSFIYKDTILPMIGRTLFYLIPLILSVATFSLLFIRRRFHLLFLPVFVAAFYFVGIRPTTDYVHLVPLLSLTGIPLAFYLRYNISSTIRMLVFLFAVFLMLLGFHTALFKGYYRWDAPLIAHNNFYSNSKVRIFINDKFKGEFDEIVTLVNKYTTDRDFIYVNSYNPLLYFITNRQEPLKSNFLMTEVDPQSYYNQVIGSLVAKEIKIVILDHKSLDTSPLKKYIYDNYDFVKTVQDFDVYVRKS